MEENLVEKVLRMMETDDDNTAKNSQRIIDTYSAADDKSKAMLDDVFISLCGYSLSTLTSEDCDE